MRNNILHYSLLKAIGLVFISCMWSCSDKQVRNGEAMFEFVDPDSSGIHFANTITTNDTLNIFTYEYLYNGGGVGIGDFNNDGLPDVFMSGNMVPGKLYINKGHMRFKDVTATSGINTNGVWAFGVSVIDINQDGLDDIYLNAGGPGKEDNHANRLYINTGNNHFLEMAGKYGLQGSGQSIQSVFFDYDRDGDLDMYLLKGGGFERSPIVPLPILKDGTARNTDRLFRNDFDSLSGHPVFTDVSMQAGIKEEGFGLGVSIIDINEDGWPDVYVSNDYMTNNLLYINDQRGGFSEQCSAYFNHTSHFAMGNDVGDINNDGLPDIMELDMLPSRHFHRAKMFGPNQYDKFYYSLNQGYMPQYMRNTLQLNRGEGKFSEIGQLAGVSKTDWSWSVLFADLDNDELQDIFITNGFGKDITDMDFVKFRAGFSSAVKTPITDIPVLLNSLNALPIKADPDFIFQNKGNLQFDDVSKSWGITKGTISSGAAYADFDRDGDMDLIVNNIDEMVHVYRNKSRDSSFLSSLNNFLNIKLVGQKGNRESIGSKVDIKYGGKRQFRYHSVVRGFESTVENLVHFGLGKHTLIDTLLITWPDGLLTLQTNIGVNQFLTIKYNEMILHHAEPSAPEHPSLINSFPLSPLGINYRHKENDFNDFNFERMLPYQYSRSGPALAVADINGDGLEDFFAGGAMSQSGSIYVQQSTGMFIHYDIGKEDMLSEDMGALFFDADNDKDQDLYIVSGSNEYTKNNRKYLHRLYINDGKGNFKKDSNALPNIAASGSCITAADIDSDGDPDLFVGARIVPGSFPETPDSRLLQNDGGKFTDVTDNIAPGLKKCGMVTCATFSDYNNDGTPDLILSGEWMPLTVFANYHGRFVNKTKDAGLSGSDGLWQSVAASDFDNDGDMDFVAGNWGLNCPYQTSAKLPMTVQWADLDNNGSIDPFISYYEEGEQYPTSSWDIIVDQVPMARKRMPNYRTFASTTTDQLLRLLKAKQPEKKYCSNLSSVVLRNNGNGSFTIESLPVEAQMAPLMGMLPVDVNNDGYIDLLGVGNFYKNEIVYGMYDACKGLTLINNGKGNFTSSPLHQSGFIVDADARAIIRVYNSRNEPMIIVSANDDSLYAFKITDTNAQSVVVSAEVQTFNKSKVR